MKEPETGNMRRALQMCGVNLDIKTCAIIWRVALVVAYKGVKFSLKDAAEIESEIIKANERSGN